MDVERETNEGVALGVWSRCAVPHNLVDLLRLWRLSLQYLHEFSREPAFATFARPALPPLCLNLDPGIDLHSRARIQLAHHSHNLVLLQAEFRRRRCLEGINRARKGEL